MKKTVLFLFLIIVILCFAGCEEKACNHEYPSAEPCESRVCTLCGYTDEGGHDYEVVSETAATLTKKGNRVEVCSVCDDKVRTTLDILTPADLNMPAVYVTDYVDGAIPVAELFKEQGEVVVKLRYESNDENIESFDCFTKIKVQGASSAYYEKRNYTVKFYEDESLTKKHKADLGWGTENQYCLKANYVDSSHARNIVGARLSAMAVATRENIHPGLVSAPNYGLIDGYPVLMYINGKFHGLYTMNIPKDHWQFGMEGDETTKEAILMASTWSNSVSLNSPIGKNFEVSGWEIEHCSTQDTAWVRESFNQLISAVNINDKTRIRNELPKYLDIEAAIDNMLLTYTLNAADNVSKNIIWVTYDGVKWIPSMYDMDATFGMFWNGMPIDEQNAHSIYPVNYGNGYFNAGYNASQMYYALLCYFPDEVEARWTQLRKDVINMDNITNLFDDFFSLIPDEVYGAEDSKWKGIPFAKENRTNMYEATEKQLTRLDEFFYSFNK